MTITASPADLYLANLSAGSQGMRQPLDVIAGILNEDHDADSYPWHELTPPPLPGAATAGPRNPARIPAWAG